MATTEHDDNKARSIGHTVSEISEKSSLLVREEIALAKVEVTRKARSLGKGLAVAAAAGLFAFFGLVFLLHTLAWGFYTWFFTQVWVGYAVVTGILFLLAGVAAAIGIRWIKRGSPPTPDMAIEEAERIKETVT